MTPSAGVLPAEIIDGWPAVLPGTVVTACETSVVLGAHHFSDEELAVIRVGPVLCVRIDDHPQTERWAVHGPTPRQRRFFRTPRLGPLLASGRRRVPVTPVLVPADALASKSRFDEWILDIHGAVGRLLMWDAERSWWAIQDADLEVAVFCGPTGMFDPESPDPSWLGPVGNAELVELYERYGIVP